MNKITINFLLFTACLSLVLLFGGRVYSQNDLSIVKVATEGPARSPNQVRNVKNDFSFIKSFNIGRQDDESLTAELGEDDIANPYKAGQWPRKLIADIDLDVRERKNAPKGLLAGYWK
jgi:hypothetical protein